MLFNTSKFPIMESSSSGITQTNSGTFYPYYGVRTLSGGVVYFMCQATGFKLKSNKELPSNDQKFSYVIPQKQQDGKPSSEQQLPMFSEIVLDGSKHYTIYLYRIRNIMAGEGKLFNQVQYSTLPAGFDFLIGNVGDPAIYGEWVENIKTALITI